MASVNERTAARPSPPPVVGERGIDSYSDLLPDLCGPSHWTVVRITGAQQRLLINNSFPFRGVSFSGWFFDLTGYCRRVPLVG